MRTTRFLPLLLIAIVLAAAGAWYSLSRTKTPAANTNTDLNTNGNGSVTPVFAEEPEGVAVNASAKIAKSTLTFVKAYRAKTFRVYTAAEGTEFIVVTFKALTGDTQAVLAEAKTSVHLVSGGQTFGPRYIDLPSSEVSTADGSFAFEVGTGLRDPELQIGTTTKIPLPL